MDSGEDGKGKREREGDREAEGEGREGRQAPLFPPSHVILIPALGREKKDMHEAPLKTVQFYHTEDKVFSEFPGGTAG